MRWSAAIENWHRIHYDQPFAVDHDGLPGLLINGSFKQHVLVQLMRAWLEPAGWLARIQMSFRGMDLVGDTLTAVGRVVETTAHDAFGLVVCEIAIRNQRGEEGTTGGAHGRPAAPRRPARPVSVSRAAAVTRDPAPGALDGVVVLDIGHGIAGPFAARLLGDLGADVVKVEEPGAGDFVRRLGPFAADDQGGRVSAVFELLNWNKRSVALDLHDPGARERLARLAQEADIAITSLRPRTLDALGSRRGEPAQRQSAPRRHHGLELRLDGPIPRLARERPGLLRDERRRPDQRQLGSRAAQARAAPVAVVRRHQRRLCVARGVRGGGPDRWRGRRRRRDPGVPGLRARAQRGVLRLDGRGAGPATARARSARRSARRRRPAARRQRAHRPADHAAGSRRPARRAAGASHGCSTPASRPPRAAPRTPPSWSSCCRRGSPRRTGSSSSSAPRARGSCAGWFAARPSSWRVRSCASGVCFGGFPASRGSSSRRCSRTCRARRSRCAGGLRASASTPRRCWRSRRCGGRPGPRHGAVRIAAARSPAFACSTSPTSSRLPTPAASSPTWAPR